MRVAALYDIHGNLPALEAVFDEIHSSGVDLIVVGGDVLPGPMPGETLEFLRNLKIPAKFILGNGDRVVLEYLKGQEPTGVPEKFREIIRWTAGQLHPEDVRWIASWPPTIQVEISGLGEALFCHATPRNDTEIFTRLTHEDCLLPVFAGISAPLVVCGHTHMQFDRTIGRTRVVNAGSVGMPYGEPGAYWLMLGPNVQVRRTQYDLAQAAARLRKTHYPQADEFIAHDLLQPRSEREMQELFGKLELK